MSNLSEIKQSSPIGIFLNPSLHYASAILAALKCGKGFVPLDVNYPLDRINYILHQCNIKIVISSSLHQEIAKKLSVKKIIFIDSLSENSKSNQVEYHSTPSSIAYIVYTSGTTGNPKGIPITHENLLPLMLWQKKHFHLGVKTRMLQNLSLTFDFGIQEILTCLLFGGTLVFPPKKIKYSPNDSVQFLKDESINTFYTTPTHLDTLLQYGALPTLNYLLVGGEKFEQRLLQRLQASVNESCKIINGYGPSEVSINVCMYFASKNTSYTQFKSLPIGRPSANNKIYLLDKDGWLVPDQVLGEIYLGGVGLAKGYIDNTMLTDQLFICHKNDLLALGRLYKTGDFGYFFANQLIYQQRQDNQKKVNGFRVELSEIQACLERIPEIASVYVYLDHSSSLVEIVAFYTTQNKLPLDDLIIISKLNNVLPSYMLPKVYIHCELFDLNKNNKIDKNNLLAQYREYKKEANQKLSACNNFVEKIMNIWQCVFIGKTISVDTDLFALGVDSLLLTKLHQEMENKLQVKFNLSDLFQYATPEKISRKLTDFSLGVDEEMQANINAVEQKQAKLRSLRKYNTSKPIVEII